MEGPASPSLKASSERMSERLLRVEAPSGSPVIDLMESGLSTTSRFFFFGTKGSVKAISSLRLRNQNPSSRFAEFSSLVPKALDHHSIRVSVCPGRVLDPDYKRRACRECRPNQAKSGVPARHGPNAGAGII